MTHYYGVDFYDGVLTVANLYGFNDIVNPSEISRTSTSNIKGGYCVYVYMKGFEQPAFCFPNLGEETKKAERISKIIEKAIKALPKQ